MAKINFPLAVPLEGLTSDQRNIHTNKSDAVTTARVFDLGRDSWVGFEISVHDVYVNRFNPEGFNQLMLTFLLFSLMMTMKIGKLHASIVMNFKEEMLYEQ